MVAALANCGTNPSGSSSNSGLGAGEDNSVSGTVAGAVGGALTNSSGNGTQAQMQIRIPQTLYSSIRSALSPFPQAMAQAQASCPTFRSQQSNCSASGPEMWLSYQDCSFTGLVTWNGVQAITMSSGTAACGTFPNPGANGTLSRQIVQSSGANVPGTATISLASSDLQATLDDASANLANFDHDNITATNSDGGYGTQVSFGANDTRTSVTVGHRISITGVMDHSVTGTVSINELPGADSRMINGSVTVYHNLLQVIGTSTFTDVLHENLCCVPVSGTITTTFAAGQNVQPTQDGQNFVGKSESLTFTGCGTAVYQGVDGHSKNVTLHKCF